MFLNVLTIVMVVLRRSSRRDTVDLEAADPAAAAGQEGGRYRHNPWSPWSANENNPYKQQSVV